MKIPAKISFYIVSFGKVWLKMKFNSTVKEKPTTPSYEGALLYENEIENQFLNMLFSSLLQETYYESAEKQQKVFIENIKLMAEKYGPAFIGKTAIFSRNILGNRSVSELCAAVLNSYKFEGKRDFYKNFFRRVDDVAETFAAIDAIQEKRSHALVRGAADYLSSLSDYSLGKYKMKGKKYNLYDIINITHAKSAGIDAYKKGTLKAPDTWEVAISTAKSQEERENEWKRLVEEHKLGYLALIRNLRNILNCDFATQNWVSNFLCPQIENRAAIKKSLVWPYQIYNSYKVLNNKSLQVSLSLEKAFRYSIDNMPKFDGNTLIILDVSGSMDAFISKNSALSIKEVGAAFAAAFYCSSDNCDFIKFGLFAKSFNHNKNDNIFTIIDKMQKNDRCGHATCFESVYKIIDSEKHYDRILLISDMQIMDTPYYYSYNNKAVDETKKYLGLNPKTQLYSFDLGNYRKSIVNPKSNQIHMITALNEMAFKFIEIIESGETIVNYINKAIP